MLVRLPIPPSIRLDPSCSRSYIMHIVYDYTCIL